MRFPRALFASLFCVLSASLPAHASSQQTFVIAAQADGYGIDECLASGARCGAHAARAYCKSRDFADASAFRQIDPAEITASSADFACRGSACGRPIAITCAR